VGKESQNQEGENKRVKERDLGNIPDKNRQSKGVAKQKQERPTSGVLN